MKICLLGGSNSVMKLGFSHGLCNSEDVQLALGASSSLQNIHALLKNQECVSKCDVIVTESNVNDFHHISIFKFNKELILNNTRSLYDELYRTGKAIISMIVPVRISIKNTKSIELHKEINDLHRQLCKKYGFHLIDITKSFLGVEIGSSAEKIIMRDTRHPLDSFMYMLGTNLRSYINYEMMIENKESLPSNFFVKDLFKNLNSFNKKNSKFNRVVQQLSDKTSVCEYNASLCGIETWCDGEAQIVITHSDGVIIKTFSDSLQFNELDTLKLTKFDMESNLGVPLQLTEPCIHKSKDKVINNIVLLTSLLFKLDDFTFIDVHFDKHLDISHVVPSPFPHITSVNKCMKTDKLDLGSMSITDLRSAAILLENVNLQLSYELMSLALLMRPDGPFLNKKVQEYKTKLKLV